MSQTARVGSDEQLARLLQIGIVLEEVVEARSLQNYRSLPEGRRDAAVEHLLEEAQEESAEHRRRLETLVDELDAESVPYEEIAALVEQQYASTAPRDFDGVLYDQLHGEESAYKFYDDVITALAESGVEFSVDRDVVVETLRDIRAEEEAGVEEVAELMVRHDVIDRSNVDVEIDLGGDER